MQCKFLIRNCTRDDRLTPPPPPTLKNKYVKKKKGLSDAAAVPADAVVEEAKGPNPFGQWIEFIRTSVLGINQFYKGELSCDALLTVSLFIDVYLVYRSVFCFFEAGTVGC